MKAWATTHARMRHTALYGAQVLFLTLYAQNQRFFLRLSYHLSVILKLSKRTNYISFLNDYKLSFKRIATAIERLEERSDETRRAWPFNGCGNTLHFPVITIEM